MSRCPEAILRAMASNYKDGHLWDHLDGKAVIEAADEITALRAQLAEAQKEIERQKNYIQLHAGDTQSLDNEVELMRSHWQEAKAALAECQKERDADKLISVSAETLASMLLSMEADDTLTWCETCGAWLEIDDEARATAGDYTGCWKIATDDPRWDHLCRSDRGAMINEVKLAIDHAKTVLASTPSTSLAKHDAEVIRRCAEVAQRAGRHPVGAGDGDTYTTGTASAAAAAILALIPTDAEG